MQVSVTYLAQLKQATGTATETVELQAGSTVRDLVARLADRHGAGFSTLVLTEDGNLRRTILLFAGQEQITWDPPRALDDGDDVTILSPIAGG